MVEASLQVTGAARLRRDLKRAGDDLSEFYDLHARIAALVAAAARGRAPIRTGALATSLRGNRAKTRASVRAGGARTAPYAGAIHWGWPGRPNPARGWRGGPVAPNTFIRDAAAATEPAWVALYMNGINKALDRVAGNTY